MVTVNACRKFILSLNDVIKLPHFERLSFRISKKIFTTLAEKDELIMEQLSLADQDVFCKMGNAGEYSVPDAWSKNGATHIDLKNANANLVFEAVRCAYELVSSKKKVN